MQLYIFSPDGHGEPSFYVMAESEAEARSLIAKRIIDSKARDDWASKYIGDSMAYRTFATAYYTMTVVDVGVVAISQND